MEIDAFEITKTIDQMYEFLHKILKACLKSCQIPCNVLYGLEDVFLNGDNKAIKSKPLCLFFLIAISIPTSFFLFFLWHNVG